MYLWGYTRSNEVKGKDGKGRNENGRGRMVGTWGSGATIGLLCLSLWSGVGLVMG